MSDTQRNDPGSGVLPVVSLRLFAFGLRQLHDPNWTGMELFDYVKQRLRGREEPVELLRKPLENGLAYYLGMWMYRDFFETDYSYFEALEPEYMLWYLEDMLQLIEFHSLGSNAALAVAKDFVESMDDMYDAGDDVPYYDRLDEAADEEMHEVRDRLWAVFGPRIVELAPRYAAAFADRVLHDRELCAYLAELMVVIGFDGDEDDGKGPRQWVERVYWPARVKDILRSRDRGVCAACGTGIVMELDADAHIDHIVPLAQGGCNDLVNLQLLCSDCNRKKGVNRRQVRTSVPPYIRRVEPRSSRWEA